MTSETSADAAGGSPQAEPAALNHEICALLSDALWLGSPDLADIEYVNPAFENLWGRAAQEVYESPQLLIDGVHPDDRERLLTVMSEQQKDWTADFRVVRPDGSERRVEVCGFSQDGGPDAEAQGGLCRDVSDRFETQASVMKSEALLAETALLAGIGGWELDVGLSAPVWTRALFEIFEVPEGEEPSFEDRVNFLHPDDRPRFYLALQDALENGQPYDLAMRATTAKGNAIHVRTIGQPVLEDGKVVRLTGVLQDITASVESQAALAKSEALLAETCRMHRLGGWERETESMEGWWTKPVFDLLELPEGETPSWNDRINFFHPEDRPIYQAAAEDALENGVPFDLELRLTTAKGNLLTVRVTGQPVVADGKTVRLWGFIENISEQVESQAALAKSEALLAEASRMARLGGWERDVENSTTVWTKSLFDLMDVPYSETPPEARSSLVIPEDRPTHEAAVQEALDNGVPFDLELRVLTAKGNLLHVRNIGQPVVVDGKTVRLSGLVHDITERVESQAALAKSEALLLETGQLARLGGWERDLENSTVAWTKSLFDLMDLPYSDTPPADRSNLVIPEDRPKHQAALKDALENGVPFDLELRILTPKGNLLYTRNVGQPVVVDGKVLRVSGLVHDITERVESQAALVKSEALLAETGRVALLGGWDLDAATLKGSWTRPLFEMLEMPAGETPAFQDRYNIYHPDDRPRHRAAVEDALENGVPFDLELRAFTAEGKLLHVRVTGRPDLVDDKVVRLWGSFQDITERIESQAALAKSETLLAETGHLARLGGWELDVETSEVVWTEPMFDIVDRSAGEIPTMQDGIDFFHPEDRGTVRAAVEEALNNGISYDMEVRASTAEGRPLRVRATGQPVLVDGKVVRLRGFLQDITELVESQAALARSEAFLAETGRMALVGGWELDLATSERRWTKPLFDIFGLPEGEPPSFEVVLGLYHPEDRPRLREALREAQESSVPYDLKLRVITTNGKLIHVRTTGQPLWADGEVVKLWGYFQDITELVESQAALAKSEAFLAETGRMALVGGWELDIETSTVLWTKPVFDIFELPEGETPTAAEVISFYHPEDQPLIAAAVQQAVESGVPFDLEVRAITAKNKPIHVRANARPLFVDGELVRMSGFVQDITERVESQAALAKSEHLFGTILQTAPDSIIMVDESGIVTSWNESSTQIFGYSQAEALGQPLVDLVIPERYRLDYVEGLERFWGSDASTSRDSMIELHAHRADGSEFPVEAAILGTNTPEGRFVIGFVRDVTERTLQAERLRLAFVATIDSMVRAIETRDPYTAAHQRNVSQLGAAIAEGLGLSSEHVNAVLFGSMIHDIGKIAVPSQILNKPGKLTEIEFEMVKGHAQVGFDIISEIDYPWPVADIVLQHHERIDGSGYPHGLRGDEISQLAQIVCVADVVEAMSAHRPYRPALGVEVALEEIIKNRGILYDPDVVDVCVRLIRDEHFEFDAN